MGGRSELFVVVMAAFVAALLTIAVYYIARARRADSWSVLLRRLKRLDRDNIATIAGDHDFSIDPERISAMIGGMEGLEALEANCAVLIDLACYVQRWYPEAVVVAEELRLNAREIQWHLGRLKGTTSAQSLKENFSDYAHPAVSIYYTMTCLLLKLYEKGNLPGLRELQRAI